MGRKKSWYASVYLLTAILLLLSGHWCCAADKLVPAVSEPLPKGSLSDGSQAQQNMEAEILLGAARNAVHLGDYSLARKRFERLLKAFPNEDQGRLEYAGLLFQANQTQKAQRQYEILLKKYPNNLSILRRMADVLLSIGDLPRVRSLLQPIVKEHPDRTDFAIDLAKVYAREGNLVAARKLVKKQIAGRPLDSDRLKIDAVELFTQIRQPDLAAKPLRELQRLQPNAPRVLAATIRYDLLVGDLASAIKAAEKFDRFHPQKHGLLLELASDLYAAKYYDEAGKIFNRLLKKEPNNTVVLLGVARIELRNNQLHQATMLLDRVPDLVRGRQWLLVKIEHDIIAGNYRHAREVLEKLLAENHQDHRAALALADLDRAEHEFIKADCRYESLGAAYDNQTATVHLARSLEIQQRPCQAESLCLSALQNDPKDSDAMLLMGNLLAKQGKLGEAVRYFQKAGLLQNERLPEYDYYTRILSGEPTDYDWDPLATAPRPLNTASVIYSLAMQEGRRSTARKILDDGLNLAPGNLVLRTHLAEWYASFGTICSAANASQLYRELLCEEPDNQKWLLGLARAESTRRCYDQSLSLYARLRSEEPTNYLIACEQARVVTSVYGTIEGLAYYDRTIARWAGLAEERQRLCIERAAKTDHVPCPTTAAVCYRKMIALEPYEPHFRFELGQVYGAVGSTKNAIHAYQNLLAVVPNHRDAKVALEGKWLDIQDRVFCDYQFRRERGRDGLTSIDRSGVFLGIHHVYDNEDEFLAAAYGRLDLAPTLDTGTQGDALDIAFQRRLRSGIASWLFQYGTPYFFIDGTLASYEHFVSTRPVGLVGLKLRTPNDLVWTVAGSMDNILENHESLRQDIYRSGFLIGLSAIPTSYWETGLNYRYDTYSDNNNRHAIEWRNRIKLTHEPDRFSLLVNMDYWNFAEPSVFQPGPDPYTGMLHPYFSPQNFLQTDVGIEYKRWLGRGPQPGYGQTMPCRLVAPCLPGSCSRRRYGDRFDGADLWWVSFSFRKRWDSEDKNYSILDGMIVWDITRRLSSYAKAEYLESTVYRSTGAYAGLSWVY